MRIGVPKELVANEARVAATPKTVEQLLKLGFVELLANLVYGNQAKFRSAAS